MKVILETILLKAQKKSSNEKILSSIMVLLFQISMIAIFSFVVKYYHFLPTNWHMFILGILVGLGCTSIIPKTEILYFYTNKKMPLLYYICCYYIILSSITSLSIGLTIFPFFFSLGFVLHYLLGLILWYIVLYLSIAGQKWRLLLTLMLIGILLISLISMEFGVLNLGILGSLFVVSCSGKKISHNQIFIFLDNKRKHGYSVNARWKIKNVLLRKELYLLMVHPIYLILVCICLTLFLVACYLGRNNQLVNSIITIFMTIMLNDMLTINCIGIEKKQLDWLKSEKSSLEKIFIYKIIIYGVISVIVPNILYISVASTHAYFRLIEWLSIFVFCLYQFIFVFWLGLKNAIVSTRFYKVTKQAVYTEIFSTLVLFIMYIYIKNTILYFFICIIFIAYRVKKIIKEVQYIGKAKVNDFR